MSRSFYYKLILLIAIHAIFQIIFITHFTFPGIINLEFNELIVFIGIIIFINMIGVFFEFKYFLEKKFKLTAYASVLGVIGYAILLITLLFSFKGRVDWETYKSIRYITPFTNILYFLSVISTKAKKMVWLKYHAIFILFSFLVFKVIQYNKLDSYTQAPDFPKFILEYCSTIISSLLIIQNFRKELGQLNQLDSELIDN